MEEILVQYMENILLFEEKGFVDEALQLWDKILGIFPDYAGSIWMEKAKMEFRNMREKDALLDFIRAYSVEQTEEIYNLVVEAYLEPNRCKLQSCYDKNMQILKEYPYYKNDYEADSPEVYVLWKDEDVLCTVNINTKVFDVIKHSDLLEIEQTAKPVMCVNLVWGNDVRYYKDKVRSSLSVLDMEAPCYLVYDAGFWDIFVQTEELVSLTEEKKLVFLIGKQSFREFMDDDMVVYPYKSIGLDREQTYSRLMEEIYNCKQRMLAERQAAVETYYRNHKYDIIKRIQNGKPRILFWTSRFTTALQYHTRDCMYAAKRMGCEVELSIESDNIHQNTVFEIMKCLCQFQPDIIFCIDH